MVDEAVSLGSERISTSLTRRISLLQECQDNERLQQIQLTMCAVDPMHFFNNYCIT